MKIPVIDPIETGNRIRQLRCEKNIRMKDFQMFFGFSTPAAIYKWEQGANMPTIDNLIILSKIFELPIDDIIVTK